MPDFMGMVARAQARTGDKDWAEAAELWARVTTANPVNGDYWARLGEARFGVRDYAGAREAYEKAQLLGVREALAAPSRPRSFQAEDTPPLMPGELAYRVACCLAAAGDREAAVVALRVALEKGMRDLARVRSAECWQELRADQRIRDMVGIIDADSMPRDDGWRYDLAFLTREIKRLAYAPFALQPETEFDQAVAELDGAIPGLTDAQILVGMMKLVRYLDDGHAGILPPEGDKELTRVLPVDMFLFTDGLYVIGAAPGCEHLLGAQVERIGGLTVGEVMAALDPVMTRDNDQWLTLRFPILVRYAAVLEALGIDQVLTVRLADATTREVRLEATAVEFHWDRYPPGWLALADTVTLDGSVAVPRPLHLRNRELPFWFEYLPAEDLVYFQFNAVRDHPAETFAAFCDQLFGFIEGHNAGRLVIDMRWNGGGNTLLTQHLLHHLIASKRLSQRGALFVIIGRQTFSAAQNTVTAIERETSAIFVGEPTGSRPNFIGEGIGFELPYSKVRANASDLFWQTAWPTDHRTWTAPDVYAPPTFEAYHRNQDPALDAILAIRERVPG
jgi:tetratricopeptide (TPR) repeat protein